MSKTIYEAVAAGFANALARIDQSDKDQAAAWLATVKKVGLELTSDPGFDGQVFEARCGVWDLARTRAQFLAPLKSSNSCRRCRRWLEGEFNTAKDRVAQLSLDRQMSNGRCDQCAEAEALSQLLQLYDLRRVTQPAPVIPASDFGTHHFGDGCAEPHGKG